MKLAAFSEFVKQNPFNTMDRSEGEAFIKDRQRQIDTWRKYVASTIEDNYGGYQNIPDDLFDYGPQNLDKK